jgi:hypothetical protein
LELYQGWQLVPTETESIYRIYWNQTRFEVNEYVYGSSYVVGQCFGNYNTPYNFVDDL